MVRVHHPLPNLPVSSVVEQCFDKALVSGSNPLLATKNKQIMKKVIFFATAGVSGTDGYAILEYDDRVTDDTIDRACWHFALDNAEMYGYYNLNDYLDGEGLDENDEHYVDSITGYWEVYDPLIHDKYVT